MKASVLALLRSTLGSRELGRSYMWLLGTETSICIQISRDLVKLQSLIHLVLVGLEAHISQNF